MQKFFAGLNSLFLWTLTAIATGVAVFGARGPTSFPVVDGIETAVCVSVENSAANLEKQNRFLSDLANYNTRLIYLSRFSIYGYGNWIDPAKASGKAKRRLEKQCQNDYFDLIKHTVRDNNEPGGAITIAFKAFEKDMPNGVWLEVAAPKSEAYLVDTGCGENCFGANGLYKVTHSAAEGQEIYRLQPFPATGGVLEAYECTLEKMKAKKWWEKFLACRF